MLPRRLWPPVIRLNRDFRCVGDGFAGRLQGWAALGASLAASAVALGGEKVSGVVWLSGWMPQRPTLQVGQHLRKALRIRIGLSEGQPDLAHGDLDPYTDLEQLQA